MTMGIVSVAFFWLLVPFFGAVFLALGYFGLAVLLAACLAGTGLLFYLATYMAWF
jgi:hypothetical protein